MSSIIIPNSSSQKRFIRLRTLSTVSNEGVKYTELTFYGENIQPVDLDKSEFDLVNLPSDNPGTFYGAEPENYLFDNNYNLSNASLNNFTNKFELPSNTNTFIKQPWAIISYMFFHNSFLHLLFNI